jgi:hypothetical protein
VDFRKGLHRSRFENKYFKYFRNCKVKLKTISNLAENSDLIVFVGCGSLKFCQLS